MNQSLARRIVTLESENRREAANRNDLQENAGDPNELKAISKKIRKNESEIKKLQEFRQELREFAHPLSQLQKNDFNSPVGKKYRRVLEKRIERLWSLKEKDPLMKEINSWSAFDFHWPRKHPKGATPEQVETMNGFGLVFEETRNKLVQNPKNHSALILLELLRLHALGEKEMEARIHTHPLYKEIETTAKQKAAAKALQASDHTPPAVAVIPASDLASGHPPGQTYDEASKAENAIKPEADGHTVHPPFVDPLDTDDPRQYKWPSKTELTRDERKLLGPYREVFELMARTGENDNTTRQLLYDTAAYAENTKDKKTFDGLSPSPEGVKLLQRTHEVGHELSKNVIQNLSDYLGVPVPDGSENLTQRHERVAKQITELYSKASKYSARRPTRMTARRARLEKEESQLVRILLKEDLKTFGGPWKEPVSLMFKQNPTLRDSESGKKLSNALELGPDSLEANSKKEPLPSQPSVANSKAITRVRVEVYDDQQPFHRSEKGLRLTLDSKQGRFKVDTHSFVESMSVFLENKKKYSNPFLVIPDGSKNSTQNLKLPKSSAEEVIETICDLAENQDSTNLTAEQKNRLGHLQAACKKWPEK